MPNTVSPIAEEEALMEYEPSRDMGWLLVRPWIWIPRLLEIIITIFSLAVLLLINSRSPKKENQKELANKILVSITNLGPCFIKVGQALSTRPDLIRSDWLEELTKLQDDLPPFEHEEALRIIEHELGSPADLLFEEFPKEPIAAASLGQVYKARLQGNYWVAVKVQRPDLRFIVRRDLVIIKLLGIVGAPVLPLNLGIGLGEIIDEFGKSLFEEIDYKKEAENAEKFAALFVNNKAITIPKVESMLSSHKVITTSWIEGTKLRDRNELKKESLDPSLIIKTGVISGIQQLLEFGFFHADPHPGNMFALRGNTNGMGHLAYVDFGMMDSISNEDRLILTGAVVHIINKDFAELAKDFQKLEFLKEDYDLSRITPVLEKVLGGSLGEEVNSFNFKEITDQFSKLMFDYPFRVPARFALIIRAIVSQEGLALRLDPNFKIIAIAYPYVAKRLLSGDSKEMLKILMEVIFDENGGIRIERIESLLKVIIKESEDQSSEIIPVASAGIKLLFSKDGSLIRNSLLMNLIKDDRLDAKELKALIKLLRKTFRARKIAAELIQKANPMVA